MVSGIDEDHAAPVSWNLRVCRRRAPATPGWAAFQLPPSRVGRRTSALSRAVLLPPGGIAPSAPAAIVPIFPAEARINVGLYRAGQNFSSIESDQNTQRQVPTTLANRDDYRPAALVPGEACRMEPPHSFRQPRPEPNTRPPRSTIALILCVAESLRPNRCFPQVACC